MNGESSREVSIFSDALDVPLEQRADFLTRACAGDEALRRKVERLLATYRQVGDFLENSPSELASNTALPSMPGQKPGDRVGNFTLLEKIGEGGCGVIYMAEQLEPIRRRVALKIVKPGMDTKAVIARFDAERQALALMDHPSIAKVFDAGATDSGRPYFVMELVRGVKITEYCDQNFLNTRERLELFVRVCQAVQHAHQKGIIHRDIKPSNILVKSLADGSPSPVIIDFGIAKATTNQRLTDKTLFTDFEMLIGTPAYMSPEQAAMSAMDVDTRSDIYSLGVLLYELLTSAQPFDASELLKKGLGEIRRIICEQDAPRPSTRLHKMHETDLTLAAKRRRTEPPILIRAVRGDLDWVVMKALEKDRQRRYETANGLALDVQRFLSDEAISARPPSTLYRFQKAVHRHKILFSTFGAFGLLLMVSLIVVSDLLSKERKANRQAQAAFRQSQEDKANAQQVIGLVEEMLRNEPPSGALGTLDETAQNIGVELTNQPSVAGHRLTLIGRLYFDLGVYDKAEQIHRAAFEINRKLYGPNSAETAAALNDLGVTLWRQKKQAEAETVLQKALELRRRIYGEDNADVAISLNNLSNVYRHDKKPAEAEPLAREALRVQKRLFGDDGLATADTLRILGVLFGDEGKGAESELIAREVLAIRRKWLQPDDPLVAASVGDLGWAVGRQGKLAEAEGLRKEALALQRKVLGDLHPATLGSFQDLAAVFEAEGKLKEAEDMHREALSLWMKKSGKDNSQVLWQFHELVGDLLAEGKYGEADRLLSEKLTPDFLQNPECTEVLALRVVLQVAQAQWDEAETNAMRLVQLAPQNASWYHMLVPLLVKTGKRSQYQLICRQILVAFSDTRDPFVADRMAQDCLLVPDSGIDLLTSEKWARIALTTGHDEWAVPYFQATYAMSQYRLGRYKDAVTWAQSPLNSSNTVARAQACAILSMSYWKLGEQSVARSTLAKGEAILQNPPRSGFYDWVGWLHSRVSLDEAAAVLGQAKL